MSLLYIREAVVACANLDVSVKFYVGAFAFEVVERTDTMALLAAAGADSGRVRLVLAEGSENASNAKVWDPGPRLFGLYSRDLEETSRAVLAAGGFAGPIVSYPYGDRTMSEMVAGGPDGVYWTIPLAHQGLHRPSAAYESDETRLHSELHTTVLVVSDHDAALAFFQAGGLETIFDGDMSGPEIERLVLLPEDASLRLSFLSGRDHLPARLELMSFSGVSASNREGTSTGIQRLIYVCDDVESTKEALLKRGGKLLGDNELLGPEGIVLELEEVSK